MAFPDMLQHLLDKVQGACAASILGFDGISIAELNRRQDLDLPTLEVELATLFARFRKVAQDSGLGEPEEMIFATGKFKAVLRAVNKEYFLLLLVDTAGIAAKGRFLLHTMVPQVLQEL